MAPIIGQSGIDLLKILSKTVQQPTESHRIEKSQRCA
jgi:hypothetical protein